MSLAVVWLATGPAAHAAEVPEVRNWLRSGRYADVIASSRQAVAEEERSEEWPLMWAQGLRAVGRLEEARIVLTNVLAQEPRSLRLRWLGHEVFRDLGDTNAALGALRSLIEASQARPWAYRSAPELAALGRAALVLGAEPKLVLDRVYAPGRKDEDDPRDAHLAAGDLALDKHDFALAARTFQEALKKLPDDADLHFGLARAYAPSDTALMLGSLETALKHNTNHVGAWLLLADHQVNAEAYDDASRSLDRALQVNPTHPEAWAYRSVIAHLQCQPEDARVARERAGVHWAANPRVPHLIGRKLSQKYRFAEGAALQREALAHDPGFLPAKAQLAQDLLRLGDAEEGWQLAREVEARDPYDVAAYNLVTLRKTLDQFRSLTNEHFRVWMTPREAAVYGPRVLRLLTDAHADLSARYGATFDRPVQVEVYADSRDFAVRTFGMPENHGFLGVCFGPVITANSPATRPGQPFNWEAMLWHEYAHVVTLRLTRNTMPRWLSEGISVYEERRANPAWGEQLIPRYREMLLDEDLTPISRLSGAFLAPPTPLHLQFAYYQSSLVVDYIIREFGFESVTSLLRDLGNGVAFATALEQRTAPIARLEAGFTQFARRSADQLAPGLDWERPPPSALLGADGEAAFAEWARSRSTNYWALLHRTRTAMDAGRWEEARDGLEAMLALYPEARGPDQLHRLHAETCRALRDTAGERKALERWATLDGDAADACRRLAELARAREDWPALADSARRWLAINPLLPAPHRYLAEATEALGQPAEAIVAYRALLQLDPPNPPEVHYRLARQLHRAGDPEAKRHLLMALEDAPRHRQALEFLQALQAKPTAAP